MLKYCCYIYSAISRVLVVAVFGVNKQYRRYSLHLYYKVVGEWLSEAMHSEDGSVSPHVAVEPIPYKFGDLFPYPSIFIVYTLLYNSQKFVLSPISIICLPCLVFE